MIRLKTIYSTPAFIDENMTIDLTVSQLAKLGVDETVVGSWAAFVEEAQLTEEDFKEGFDVNDPSTYEAFGFDITDPDSWYNVIG